MLALCNIKKFVQVGVRKGESQGESQKPDWMRCKEFLRAVVDGSDHIYIYGELENGRL